MSLDPFYWGTCPCRAFFLATPLAKGVFRLSSSEVGSNIFEPGFINSLHLPHISSHFILTLYNRYKLSISPSRLQFTNVGLITTVVCKKTVAKKVNESRATRMVVQGFFEIRFTIIIRVLKGF